MIEQESGKTLKTRGAQHKEVLDKIVNKIQQIERTKFYNRTALNARATNSREKKMPHASHFNRFNIKMY